jgi:hypothetical protein
MVYKNFQIVNLARQETKNTSLPTGEVGHLAFAENGKALNNKFNKG